MNPNIMPTIFITSIIVGLFLLNLQNVLQNNTIKSLETQMVTLQEDKKVLQKDIYENKINILNLQKEYYSEDIRIGLELLKNTSKNLNDCEFNGVSEGNIEFYCFGVEQDYILNTKTKTIITNK